MFDDNCVVCFRESNVRRQERRGEIEDHFESFTCPACGVGCCYKATIEGRVYLYQCCYCHRQPA